MSNTSTPSKTIWEEKQKLIKGKMVTVREPKIRTFLWDNPELRKAFHEANEKERREKELRKQRSSR